VNTDASLTFAILAGGAATRMGGRDKGLELLDGKPLVAWVMNAIATMQRDSMVLIVANRHHEAYACHAQTISDSEPGFQGPLAGIAAALDHCKTTWLLTLPVDCPAPPYDLAMRLLQYAREGDHAACVAHDGECRQPMFAIYRRELAAAAATALAAGQGAWHWQDAIGARELDFSDRRRQFHNLNTTADLAAHVASRRPAS
jgi:molybdenum cofactor guanylyltransferase